MLPASLSVPFRHFYDGALIWLQVHAAGRGILVELLVLALALTAAWLGHRRCRAWLERHADRLHPGALRQAGMALAAAGPWLLLALVLQFAAAALADAHEATLLLRLVISLTLAWVVIRFATRLVRDPRLARGVAILAWVIAALNILDLIGPTTALLNAMAFNVGALRLSVLLLIKAGLILALLIWLANAASRLIEARLLTAGNITPAIQVLATKLTRAALLTLAVVLALGAVGIDLTAFAVFSGAIGVGVGFGLQKVVSNLISGVILLLDSSIKPGDVIELQGTYGWISQLNARYVSVVTRDGTEHLIPNEDLITQRVVNWTYSNERVRLHVPVGISYKADPREAIRLCIEAAQAVPRILKEPRPICLLRGFGDSSVNLELRFWIEDARAGTANVESEVLLGVWDRFQANGIEIPFPQRDLHLITPESDEAAALASHLERPSQRGISRAEVGPADEVARKAQPPR